MRNSIGVGEALRRLGVKGSVGQLDMAPFIVPTFAMGDLADLVSAPQDARAWAGQKINFPLAASSRGFKLIPKTEVLIERLFIAPGRLAESWVATEDFLTSGVLPKVDMGLLPTTTTVYTGDTAGMGGAGQHAILNHIGSVNMSGMSWRVAAGQTFAVYLKAAGAAFDATFCVQWLELPTGSIVP